MILCVGLSSTELVVGLASSSGAVIASTDATWRVGSGQSFATHVDRVLREASADPTALKRIGVAVTGGSLTTTRTTMAFVNSFAWVRELPIFEASNMAEPTLEALGQFTAAADISTAVTALFPKYD